MLGSLAADPSVHGLFTALDLGLQGVEAKAIDLQTLDPPLAAIAAAIQSAQSGHPVPLSWQTLLSGGKALQPQVLRRFLLVQPVLNYNELEPGAAASEFLRQAFKGLGYDDPSLVRLRLTGPVALSDEEFASVADGSGRATLLSIVLVTLCLTLALRSWRLILPILATLFSGLAITSAFGLWLYGSLNLISVAFAVMFIGIAVDFGIQYGVRYRAERHKFSDPRDALASAAQRITKPLLLAAAAAASGFLAFTPTAYAGVSELGVIAGFGMACAALLNLTLLPALLRLFHPRSEPHAVGFVRLRPLDDWMIRHRRKVRGVLLLIAGACLFIAPNLRFDFDPLHLKDPHTESVSTLYDLMKDPQESPYGIDIIRPNLDEAAGLAKKIGQLADVDSVLTLASFIPEDQPQKLAILSDLAMLMGPALMATSAATAPDQAATLQILRTVQNRLQSLGGQDPAAQALASALAKTFDGANAARIAALQDVLLHNFPAQLAHIRDMLAASSVTLDSLPADLKRDWVTPDGRARIDIFPKGDMTDSARLHAFTAGVRTLAPDATGSAISIQESAHTVVGAFIQAGCTAIVVIFCLLLLALRRVGLVLRLLAPVFLASLLTAASCVLLDWPITYANIIALPLFLGLGVSFAIYFVLAWQRGTQHLLSASVTRAVLFSATTTMVAFGSLALSNHPGTHQMGFLLALALCYVLATILVFLPPLLGQSPATDAPVPHP